MPDLVAARVLSELLGQSPFLLACAGGVLIALKVLPRCRTAGLLLLAGALLMLATVIVTVLLHHEIAWAALRERWPHEQALRVEFFLSLGSSCLRATAVGLYLAAALMRRSYPTALLRQWWSGEPDDWASVESASAGQGGEQ